VIHVVKDSQRIYKVTKVKENCFKLNKEGLKIENIVKTFKTFKK